jgi:8-oxo-dGTP diphosphatase
MDSISPPIRNTVRALILRDQNILLLRKVGYAGGDRFALPGGGQELDETLEQALERECLEEIGTQVHIGNLIYVADCFKPRDTQPPSTRHLVEFLFTCSVPDEYVPVNGHHPDKHQLEVVWVRLDELQDKVLYPRSMSNYLVEFKNADNTVYLGTIDW